MVLFSFAVCNGATIFYGFNQVITLKHIMSPKVMDLNTNDMA